MFKSGFVSVIGRPNVGKSTLINKLVGNKVSIVSYKPQTTRDIIRGIYNDDECQIIFTDTPGIHKSSDKLGDFMNESAESVTHDSEIILMLVDAEKKAYASDKYVLDKIKNLNLPVFLVVNKIDKITKNQLIEFISYYQNHHQFKEIIPISALKKDNLNTLVDLIKKYLPEGPMYYPKEMVSDHPKSFQISEIIREKILFLTQEEVPYSIGIYCEDIQEKENNIKIRAIILVERDSQKGIIIGQNGKMLQEINKQASIDLRKQFNKKIYLELYVKAYKNWRNNLRLLKMLGYEK